MEPDDRTPDTSQAVMATVRADEPREAASACATPVPTDPCTIAILGATGDLTARKLMPALFDLWVRGGLPEPCRIVGCGRSPWTDNEFRNRMQKAVFSSSPPEPAQWASFSPSLHYRRLDYQDRRSFDELAESLSALDRTRDTRGNRIFYLALPPVLYEPVAGNLGGSGLGREGLPGGGWTRMVLEKPFGSDLESSRRLDQCLHEHFKERQIFRIDHYLAKETVQNVLMFRFANSIFEPIWNRRYIDHVSIRATETLGVAHRAGYYERGGVLRDMFQNHMMQLLALTAMEPPPRFEADLVRDETAKVFSALRPFPVQTVEDHLVLGQYGAGTVDGRPVPAYRDEDGVSPGSLTPTFAMMRVFLDNWRWQGVPFFMASGKRLTRKLTEIAIQFKPVPLSLFRHTLEDESISANRLVLGIYPDEKITLTFQTKTPGAAVCLRTVTMDFNYHQNYAGPIMDAYEKAILDCMLGDRMLFWRQDGIERSWAFLTPVLEVCENCSDRAGRLHYYPAGSRGPAAIARLTQTPAERESLPL
jgi:glucose-6-phosphate 1-dehydrogenase